MKYLINVELTRTVEVENEDDADANFWDNLQQEHTIGNTTLEVQLTESMTKTAIGESKVFVKKKYCCPVCHSEYDDFNEAEECETDCNDELDKEINDDDEDLEE